MHVHVSVLHVGDLLFAGLLPPIGSNDDIPNPSAKYNYSGARVEVCLCTCVDACEHSTIQLKHMYVLTYRHIYGLSIYYI